LILIDLQQSSLEMNPNNNSSDTLSSLYKAIGLIEGDAVPCFAQTEGDTNCIGTVPNTRRKHIKGLLQTLALDEFGSEDPDTVQTVKRNLAELAKSLVCNQPVVSHAVKFELDGKRYKDNREYVFFLLTSKFKSWQLKRRVEEQRNNQQHTPTRAPRKSSAKPEADASTPKNMRTSDQDTYGSSHEDSEETDDEDVFGERKREKLERPKLVGESPQGEREVLVTPVRSRRSRNRYTGSSGARAAKESSQSPSYLLSRDDEFIVSPGSVTSPDADEVFTPLSAVSTPDSLASTVGFESRRSSFRSSYGKRQDTSLGRRVELTDLDILSRDMRQKLNLSRSISDKEGEFDDESSPDIQSQNAESDEEAPIRPSMRLVLKRQPVGEILELMAKPPDQKGFERGWIYGFTDPSVKGHIKIGYTKNSVETRMKKWRRDCAYEPLVKFKVSMPCAVKRMEGLIHRTLHMEKEVASCPAKSCKAKHREWFKISEEEALGVVKIWQQFSKLEPYTEERQLNDIWKSIVAAQRAKPWSSGTKEWLREELLTIVSKETKLRVDLDEATQAREKMEQQLLKAEKDEEHFRKQLEGLVISNKVSYAGKVGHV
jgi:hypothetical protein